MSITVEQLRFAIEEDEADYSEFDRQVEASWKKGYFYTVSPANGEGWSEFAHEGGDVIIDGERLEAKVIATTGGEDEGSNASSTFQIGDQYFRKEGYYASHYGYDWDGELTEVRPVKKMVTVFE